MIEEEKLMMRATLLREESLKAIIGIRSRVERDMTMIIEGIIKMKRNG